MGTGLRITPDIDGLCASAFCALAFVLYGGNRLLFRMQELEMRPIDAGRWQDSCPFGQKCLTAGVQTQVVTHCHFQKKLRISKLSLRFRINIGKTKPLSSSLGFVIPLGKTYSDLRDPFFLQNEAGQKILSDHLRPRKIILMHMRPNEVDRYAQELGQDYDDLLVFHEPMEKKIFRKAAAPKSRAEIGY